MTTMACNAGPKPGSEKLIQRRIAIPKHGTLVVTVPESWKQEVRRPPKDLPPTIEYESRSSDDFEVLITCFWHTKGDPNFNTAAEIKQLINEDAEEMSPTVVEKKLDIKTIRGRQGTGYYYAATDKARKKGEYPLMTRAAIGVDDLLLVVTVLHQSNRSDVADSTIKMLENARKEE